MNKITNLIAAVSLGLVLGLHHAQSQTLSQTSLSLVSQIQRAGGGDGTFSIAFGSLNGGLAALTSLGWNMNSVSTFASWYAANSRTLYTWTGVTGSAIDSESNDYYRNFTDDITMENRVGGPLASIYSTTQNNEALAFVTYSVSGAVEELGLFSFGVNWENPTAADFPGNNFAFDATGMSAVLGGLDTSANYGYGIASTVTATGIPEPTSGSLFLLGAAGVLALRRLRKTNV